MSNSDEDIRIEFTALEPGWQIKGKKAKVIRSYCGYVFHVFVTILRTDLPEKIIKWKMTSEMSSCFGGTI